MKFLIYRGFPLIFLIFLSMKSFPQSGPASFRALWAKVDSLEQKGLTRSALDQVLAIQDLARKESQALQHIKALLYQLKYESIVEEQSDQKGAFELEAAAQQAEFPQKQILNSYLGWYYWQYYQNYRYLILERNALQVAPEDFQTWDARQFHQKISSLFLQSLEERQKLQEEPIGTYKEILFQEKGSDSFRPTLYDLLAHQALGYFTNGESRITQAQELFKLSVDQGLLPAEEFVSETFVSPDSLAPLFLATHLYQQLLAFHLTRTSDDPSALIEVDLARLNFVSQQAEGKNIQVPFRARLQEWIDSKWSSHPAVANVYYTLAASYVGTGNMYHPITRPETQWDLQEAHELCNKAIKLYPESPGALQCQNLRNRIEVKQLSIELEEAILPSTPSLVKVSFKNVSQIYFKVVSAPERRGGGYDRYRLMNLLKKKKSILEWEEQIPEGPYTGDFQSHSSEVLMKGLPMGDYILLASDSKDFSYEGHGITYAHFQVSELSYFSRANPYNGNLEVFVVNRETGAPLHNVGVQAYFWDYNSNSYKKSGSKRFTNDLGYMDIPGRQDYRSFELELSLKKDRFRSHALYAYSYGNDERPEQEEIVSHFFLDRKIYRPGQTVQFKGIVLSNKGEKHDLKKSYPCTIRLYDVNGEEVSKLDLRTNNFGSVSGSFSIPTQGLLGRMRLETEGGSTDFSVEEYKRPSFEVSLESPMGPLALGDTAQVEGFAKSFAGVSLAEVEVRYRVVRKAQFPYWWYGYRRPIPSSPEREIASGRVESDGQGTFSIDFPLLPDEDIAPEDKPLFFFEVQVDVVDHTGETQHKSLMVQVGYDPFVLGLDGPDELPNTQTGSLTVRCEKAPVASDSLKGTLEIFRLTDPGKLFLDRKWSRPDIYLLSKGQFEANFPYLPYEEEDNPLNWPRMAFASPQEFLLEASHSISLDALKGATPGMYLLKVSALDGQVSNQQLVTVYDPKAGSPAIPEILNSRLSQRRAEPGEKVTYSLLAEENKTWVYYEVEHDGEILDARFVRLKRNKALEIPIHVEESHRGNLILSTSWVRHNRFGQESHTLQVPWTNKQLSLEWSTIRSELEPGSSDTWKLTIKGPESEAVSAEMVATLYDASLDLFRSNSYSMDLYPTYYRRLPWNGRDGFGLGYGQMVSKNWNPRGVPYSPQGFDRLNGFGFLNEYLYGGFGGVRSRAFSTRVGGVMMREESIQVESMMSMDAAAAPVASKAMPAPMEEAAGAGFEDAEVDSFELNQEGRAQAEEVPSLDFDQLEIRKDFRETAFFFPHLQTDDSGHVQLEFSMPEALTRWKFLGLAHTQDLQVGTLSGEVVTKKKLMAKASLPRFLREGDRGSFHANISNLTEGTLEGTADIQLLDALTMEPLGDTLLVGKKSHSLSLEAGESTTLAWDIQVPEGSQAIVVRIGASAQNYTDGEEHILPILPNRMLVTESLPLAVRGKGTHTFSFDKLKASDKSESLKHESLTLEFTSNPIWYAIQSLPYLMEFPHECTEQIFSRYYANAMAHHVATSDPTIKQVFAQWQKGGDGLVSALHKNEEVKALLLQETPWVMAAKNEKERKQRMGVLFDVNRMASELSRARKQLLERQYGTGGFSWFPGMRPSRYITQLIATGMGNLQHLGVSTGMGNAELADNMRSSIAYLDKEIKRDYDYLLRYEVDLDKDNLSSIQVQYLYMRSFYEDIPFAGGTEKAISYYRDQARKYWVKKSKYDQGMLALSFHRGGEAPVSSDIMKSLKENAVFSDELGMYWKEMSRGYYWYQAPIERHALLLEAFNEVAKDQEAVEGLQVWLLKNKQTNDWKTTRATVAACQALVATNQQMLEATPKVEIGLGEIQIDPLKDPEISVEAGTGYFRKSWDRQDVSSDMANIKVEKPEDGLAWGAVYWQYFEDLDKITYAETPLSLQKALFREEVGEKGPELIPISDESSIEAGDKVVVRIELRVDRDMEYVHMKDMRAAGFEPINVLSTYKYRAGLGFYESTRDAATHFFFDYLPKGTHVFEYPLRATHTGEYANGIATIQCMYAPEFTSHSEGIRIQIK